jgi:hypothetical protein
MFVDDVTNLTGPREVLMTARLLRSGTTPTSPNIAVVFPSMKAIAVGEMFAKLSSWKREGAALLATFTTTGQVALGGADLDEVSDQKVTITLRRVIKHVRLSDEQPLVQATLVPAEIMSVWLTSTLEGSQTELANYFDEVLLIITAGGCPTVQLSRGSSLTVQ